MFLFKQENVNQFYPLEVVNRGSDAQLQEDKDLNYINMRIKSLLCPKFKHCDYMYILCN